MKNLKLVILLILGLIPSFIFSGTNGGRAGFDFLRTEMGARPASMGGAFIAVVGDLHGVVYNPASIADVQDMETCFTFLDHLLDIKSGFVGFAKSLNKAGRIGIGISYINYGEMKQTDILGAEFGTFTPGDFVFTGSYGDSLSIGLHYGASVKFIHSKIAQYTASGLAADFGLIYRIPKERLNIGIAVLNVGKALNAYIDVREKLPTSYRIGVSQRLAHLPLLINLNFIKYQYEKSSIFLGLYWALGGEFTITENLFLRWGYNSRGSEEKVGAEQDRFAGVSLGLGIRFGKYRLDYGRSSYGAVGSMNYFTVTICF